MLGWKLFILIIAIVSAFWGFRGDKSTTTQIAKLMFYVSIILFFVLLFMALFSTTPAPSASPLPI